MGMVTAPGGRREAGWSSINEEAVGGRRGLAGRGIVGGVVGGHDGGGDDLVAGFVGEDKLGGGGPVGVEGAGHLFGNVAEFGFRAGHRKEVGAFVVVEES